MGWCWAGSWARALVEVSAERVISLELVLGTDFCLEGAWSWLEEEIGVWAGTDGLIGA
jgi:hypothetical protein